MMHAAFWHRDSQGHVMLSTPYGTPYGNPIEGLNSTFPTPLLRTISLPVHEVLETLTSPPDIQKPTDREGRSVIDDPGWRRGTARGGQSAVHHRLELRDVERRVNLHGRREFQANSAGVDDLVDLKRPHEARCQLTGFHFRFHTDPWP